MSLPHFYLENQVIASEGTEAFPLRLSPDDAKHARALRLAPGEHVAVVDAAQDYFECEVVSFADAVPLVRVACRLDADGLRPSVMLVQGLGEGRQDGDGRAPCHGAGRGRVRAARLRAFGREAGRAEGSGPGRSGGSPSPGAPPCSRASRRYPKCCPPVRLDEACALLSGATAVLVCWEEAPGTAHLDEALGAALADLLMPPEDARVAVVVGPEGGLAPAEVEALLACNPRASLVTLGPTILRTETAGVVAPALVLHELRRMARGRCAL